MTRQLFYALILSTNLLAACGGGSSGGAEPGIQAALPHENGIGFLNQELSVSEQQRSITVQVFRAGDAQGEASVRYATSDLSTTVNEDYTAASGTLSWADGETGVKSIQITVHSDLITEPRETLTLELSGLLGVDPLVGNPRLSVSVDDSACSSVLTAQASGSVALTDHCYRQTGTVTLAANDLLQMAPGVTVFADAGTGITVGKGAVVQLLGSTDKPVTLRGTNAQPGHWAGLTLLDSSDSANTLTYTVIRDAETALSLNSLSLLPTFSSNRFTGNHYAVSMPLPMVTQLDKNSSFSGNTNDYVEIAAGILDNASTLSALDVPYRFSGNLVSNAGLEIEAGARLQFSEGGLLFVSTSGFLRAVGTDIAPIVFSGATATAGFWDGIHFSTATSSQNRLDHVRISDAGGDPARPGNIAIFGGNPVMAITNSTLSNSASNGIWVSASQFEIDTAGTVFESINGQDFLEI